MKFHSDAASPSLGPWSMLDHVSWLRQAQLLSRASCQASSGALNGDWLPALQGRSSSLRQRLQMDGWCLWLHARSRPDDVRQTAQTSEEGTMNAAAAD